MSHPKDIRRHTIRCVFRCKHCREVIGAENIAHYGRAAPDCIAPSWFFAAMMLLDHLRDCRQTDLAADLRARYGEDFLNHPQIHEFFNVHATIERTLVKEEDLNQSA